MLCVLKEHVLFAETYSYQMVQGENIVQDVSQRQKSSGGKIEERILFVRFVVSHTIGTLVKIIYLVAVVMNAHQDSDTKKAK